MCTTEVPDESSVLSFAFQQVASAYAPMFIVATLGLQLGALSIAGQAAVAFGLALLIGKGQPRSTLEGRWVWVFPALFFASGLALSTKSSDVHHEIMSLLDVTLTGKASLLLILVTFPFCNSVVYSVCMYGLRKSANTPGAPPEPPF